MNTDILEGKWRQIRGRIKTQWGKLTDDELDEIERDLDMLLSEEPSPRMR